MIALLAAQSTKTYWYITRGSGAVATILLSAVMVLGVLTSTGFTTPQLPRFVVQGLHRNVSLLAMVFVLIHVATTIVDGYVAIGWIDAIVPLHTSYHPGWVGLGTVAFDLMLAVVLTSLLRVRMTFGSWRLVHWTSYASWPLAMLHGFEVGSDRHATWMLAVNVGCLLAVVGAVLGRLWSLEDTDRRLPAYRRAARR